MVIWRGWGILAFLYAFIAMILFAGLGSTLLADSVLPFSITIGLLAAAAGTWFTGIAMNRTTPQRKIDAWAQGRRAQLDELLATGRFSLGPGYPQPTSTEEARQMADAVFARELEQTKQAYNVHTLFWIPMQYIAFVWAAIALIVFVAGLIGLTR
ncbi:hypothetical protein [Okibacterium endophyticum]